jgi:TIR domain
MRQDVFVSYSQPDRACALEIVAQLEARGVKVWVAPRDIPPSADWAAEIIEAITTSRLMLLVFSTGCNDSSQVRREVERAVHRRLPILPVRIEDVLPTKSLEYFLSAQHWFDAFPAPLARHYDRLCQQVSELLRTTTETSREPASATGANRPPPPQPFPPPQLESLEKKLAFYVGPMARHLVKRAAATAPSWNELTLRLAGEIEPAAARQEFIESCIQAPPA